MTWLLHILGIDSESSRWYAWWSGAGSDLGEFALFGAAVAFYRRHTCHVDDPRFCWRWAAHPVAGTPFRACRKHHPQVPDRVSAEDIHAAHRDAQASTERPDPR